MRSVTPSMFSALIDALENGTSLKVFVRDNNKLEGDYPSVGTFYNYINADSARLNKYILARETYADSIVDEIVEIADEKNTDPSAVRNRIAARQWAASKLKPKTYGDKLDIDVKGQIDVQAAVLAGRRRIQTIDNPAQSAFLTSDTQSDVALLPAPDIDPFS